GPQAAAPGTAGAAAIDATFMIVPDPCRTITGTTARQVSITPRRLTASIASQSAVLPSATGPNTAVPAAVTRTSTRANAASVCRTRVSTALSEVTSVGTA